MSRIACIVFFALLIVPDNILAGFSIAALLVFYARISRNDSPAIGAFNHCLYGVFLP